MIRVPTALAKRLPSRLARAASLARSRRPHKSTSKLVEAKNRASARTGKTPTGGAAPLVRMPRLALSPLRRRKADIGVGRARRRHQLLQRRIAIKRPPFGRDCGFAL